MKIEILIVGIFVAYWNKSFDAMFVVGSSEIGGNFFCNRKGAVLIYDYIRMKILNTPTA
jgi:hypothetical protein